MAFEFREYRMQFERVPPGTRAVDRRALGRRSKLGGKPTWEHGGQTPACARCSEPMSFLAQIDSIEHEDPKNPHAIDALSDDQQYMFGDVGMVYVFLCLTCGEGATVIQSG
ncbi:hypothetical protein J421_5316 (plasmid) [Gemmatirosa kalamazoonensis]|uniref:DUF1963 domain-containing protein n=1 Tax=Gemmatirosa kalamazoonensis TaxID=861299 RepID=W0RQ67_9BACT|nr:DUF1963 domain-containing protein [Gemmatirosa kalamazoonensis]AHG92851.1 hypothetical protein J421_5316 [Gemmatirosa kalamazoonensis]